MEAPRAPGHRGCERAYIPIKFAVHDVNYTLADVFQYYFGQNI